jgi:hypothetical protein
VIEVVSGVARLLGRQRVALPVVLPQGVEVRESGLITTLGGYLSGMGGPAAGVTLGRVILVRPGAVPGPRLLRHELAHVRQWERNPLSFPFRYVAAHIRHGYMDNPYEAEARAAERGPPGPGARA